MAKKNESTNQFKFCNYDEFIKALKQVSKNSKELTLLQTTLDISNIKEDVSGNKMNSILNQYRNQVDKALKNLPKDDFDSILDALQKNAGRKLSINKGFIINSYKERLKNSLQEMSNKSNEELESTIPEETDDKSKYKNITTKGSNKKQPKGHYSIYEESKKDVSENTKETELTVDYFRKTLFSNGLSVIDYIDHTFSKNVLENFFNRLKNINPNDNLSKYIDETNKLIESSIFELYLPDAKKVIRAIKENYKLEFSPIKDDMSILEEIISDELRFYQQKLIEDKLADMDTSFLGTSKRITKVCATMEHEDDKMIFEELHTINIPHYAFTQKAFNSPFVIKTKRGNLPEDYADKHLNGASFLAYPAIVTVVNNGKDGFTVYSGISSKFKLYY